MGPAPGGLRGDGQRGLSGAATTTGMPSAGSTKPLNCPDVKVFHAGTHGTRRAKSITNGGRVLGVTALGSSIANAKLQAYTAVKCIRWNGAWCRKDISDKALPSRCPYGARRNPRRGASAWSAVSFSTGTTFDGKHGMSGRATMEARGYGWWEFVSRESCFQLDMRQGFSGRVALSGRKAEFGSQWFTSLGLNAPSGLDSCAE